MKERMSDLETKPPPVVQAFEFDYDWAGKHLEDLKGILRELGYNREILNELWGDKFALALRELRPPMFPPINLLEKASRPDIVLRVAAAVASSSILAIAIILMLQYLHN